MNKLKIVHYMHVNKFWFYWLDDSEQKRYWRKIEIEEDLKRVSLLSEEIITERQAKGLLRELFRENKIMKAIPYHYSPSPFGSRPVKVTVDRKRELKDKIKFREELLGSK